MVGSEGRQNKRFISLFLPNEFHNLSCPSDDVSTGIANNPCHFHGVPACPGGGWEGPRDNRA